MQPWKSHVPKSDLNSPCQVQTTICTCPQISTCNVIRFTALTDPSWSRTSPSLSALQSEYLRLYPFYRTKPATTKAMSFNIPNHSLLHIHTWKPGHTCYPIGGGHLNTAQPACIQKCTGNYSLAHIWRDEWHPVHFHLLHRHNQLILPLHWLYPYLVRGRKRGCYLPVHTVY